MTELFRSTSRRPTERAICRIGLHRQLRGTLNFAEGETSKSFTVSIIDDVIDEANETFTVSLSSPTGGATFGTVTSTVTIIDNDPSRDRVTPASRGRSSSMRSRTPLPLSSSDADPIRDGLKEADESGLGGVDGSISSGNGVEPHDDHRS